MSRKGKGEQRLLAACERGFLRLQALRQTAEVCIGGYHRLGETQRYGGAHRSHKYIQRKPVRMVGSSV